MSIKDHIRDDEEIEANFKNEYATDRRIIKHKQGTFSEKMEDLDYDHISSISVQRKTLWTIAGIGAVIFLLGLNVEKTPITIFGGAVTLFALLYRRGRYVLQGDGGETMVVGEHGYLTKIWNWNKADSEEFVEKIRTRRRDTGTRNNLEKDNTSKESDKEDNEEIENQESEDEDFDWEFGDEKQEK